MGGAGEGPGEIRFLYHVDRVRGDTLVIGGWPIGSRYWFDESGAFVRDQALGPWFPGMLGRTLVDGSLILDTFEFGSYGNTLEHWAADGPDDDIRPEGIVELVSADGSRVDTLAAIRGEWWHKSGTLRQNFAMHALPYTPVGLVAWSLTDVFIGHTERAEVRGYSREGKLIRILRWPPQRVAVSGADRAAFRDEVMNGVRRPDQAPFLRRWLSEMSYPDAKPAFSAMISDERGFLWVRPSAPADAESVDWLVFGPDGPMVAYVAVPAELTLLDVDDTHALAKWTDELGVELVNSYRVMR